MKGLIVLLVVVLVLILTVNGQDVIVDTKIGKIQGQVTSNGVRVFKGIPYAQPPIGDLRWEYPLPAEPFKDTYVANYDAPGCQQVLSLSSSFIISIIIIISYVNFLQATVL